jgi:hypothetical protein
LCVVCGIVGQLRIMVWLFAAGTTLTWTSILVYRTFVPSLDRRVSQSS